ncbi:MAG: hypothetical protein OXB97_04500 [Rhodospirillales bacterium]|nr:hypothetical protein [Rhodospirillales bacterium]
MNERALTALLRAMLRWVAAEPSIRHLKARSDEDVAASLTLAVCEALHARGRVRLPSREAAAAVIDRWERDERIRRQRRDGRSIRWLARKHRLSARHVRRVLETNP